MDEPRPFVLTLHLLRRVRRHQKVLVAMLVFTVLAALAEAAPIALAKVAVGVLFAGDEGVASGFTQWFVDAGGWFAEALSISVENPRIAAMGLMVAAVLVVGALTAVATYASTFLGRYMAALVVKDLRCSLMRRVLSMPVNWFTRRKVGDILSRFSTDVERTYSGVIVFLTVVVLQPLILVTAVGAAFILSWRLAIAATVVLPLFAFPLVILGHRVRKHSTRSLVSLGEATESVNQALSGLRVIKAFSAEEHEDRRYQEVNERWMRRQVAVVRAKAASRGLMDVVYTVSLAVVLALGGYLVLAEKWDLNSETFIAFLVALATMYRPMKRLAKAYTDWQASMAAARRVFAVLNAEPEGDDEPDHPLTIGPVKSSIVFDNVSFSYRDEEEQASPVLRDISFEIPAGKTVALVGPSGSGKSTIADLVFRFRRPDTGRVLIDGISVDQVRHESLLEQMAIVSQRPFLFNTTIRDNIAYARPRAPMESIEAAARAAQIHDLIISLPEGYDTRVGEQGASLSGGQLQRVTIARAILKDASFLLLDEATSNLDVESERAVQVALRNLLAGRTTLVIAHRLSTVVDADHILVIEGGRIVEQGTHEDLVRRDGTYARLYRARD